ncbi:hypothetical protein BGZ79_007170 [Entomortierella chlamydospora]|nr:hypothetical protein BGZ79_007170 [Entomortierella chlamydospora]
MEASKLATKYGTNLKELLRLNPGLPKNCGSLDVGNYICMRGPREIKTPVVDNTIAPAPGANQAPALTHVPATTNVDPSLNKAPVQPNDDTAALKPKTASQIPSTNYIFGRSQA